MAFESPSRTSWPSGVQLDLLRAALLQDERAVAAWGRWRDSAARHRGHDRIVPLAVWNLRRLTGCDELTGLKPDPAQLTWTANGRLLDEVLPALGDLITTTVPVVLLKGVALAHSVYPSLALRRIGDVDVLVRADAVAAAAEVLRSRGFVEVAPRTESARQHLHSFGFARASGAGIDLHAFALYECAAPGFDDGFWSRRVPFSLRGQAASTLAPCDHLLLTCVHGLRFSREPAVHWLADATLLLRAAGSHLDWDVLAEEARARRLEAPLHAALRLLRDALEAPVPDRALESLSRGARRPLRRLELRARTRPPTLMGGLLLHLCDYRRLRLAPGAQAHRKGFLGYLKDLWGLTRARDVPATAARKAWSRLRRAADSREAADPHVESADRPIAADSSAGQSPS